MLLWSAAFCTDLGPNDLQKLSVDDKSRCKLFDTLIVFPNRFLFEKVNFDKSKLAMTKE